MSLLRPFKCAIKGILYCLNKEKHMRIHTVVALYVLAFSWFYNFSSMQYSILILTIGLVFSAEVFNTSIERLCDLFSTKPNPLIKIIKDIAAGAVMVCAFSAVIIGLFLFWDIEVFLKILLYFKINLIMLIIFLVSLPISHVFIKKGFLNFKKRLFIILKLKIKGVE